MNSGASVGDVNMPTAPVKSESYTFVGWYTERNGGGSPFTGSTTVTGDITVYAYWQYAVQGDTLQEALTWLKDTAEEGGDYIITVKADESLAGAFNTLSYDGKTVRITLVPKQERVVSLSSTGALFTIGSGVTLTLGDNVTLQGISDNTTALVRVSSGGTLAMKTGSKISGNTASYGGGVQVEGGTFIMSGGTISGNTANYGDGNGASGCGGGVYLASGMFTMSGGVFAKSGTFTMSDGTISGNTASSGGGVYVYFGTFTKEMGGIIYGSNEPNSALKNTATGGGGHAVYVDRSSKKRNTTAGTGVSLNSGMDGNWEE